MKSKNGRGEDKKSKPNSPLSIPPKGEKAKSRAAGRVSSHVLSTSSGAFLSDRGDGKEKSVLPQKEKKGNGRLLLPTSRGGVLEAGGINDSSERCGGPAS